MSLRSIVAAAGLAAALSAAPAAAAPGLQTGLAGHEFIADDDAFRDHWFGRAVKAKASIIRINTTWSSLASTRPAMPTNPADPAYRFSELDRAVTNTRARGLRPMLTIFDPPEWATSSGCGTHGSVCKPNVKAFGELGTAIARRYAGSFAGLPRVDLFEAWNEPNLSLYLAPQWKGKKPVAPSHYRKMLNAFHSAVKSVQRSNKVITAGTAPFGDSGRGPRMKPVAFWRRALCLNRKLRQTCSGRARFDALAHHAINPRGSPGRRARHRDDAAVPDLNRIRRVLRAAERRGRAPGGRHPLWMTEMWWETNPPDAANGVRLRKQAAWIVRTMWEIWRDGARVAINFRVRDERFDGANPAATLQAGLYFHSGKAKPAVRAFRFPFLARRKSGKRVMVWGRSPRGGKLRIQRKKGKRWRTVRSRKIGARKVFKLRARGKGKASWRAKVGSTKSLSSKTG